MSQENMQSGPTIKAHPQTVREFLSGTLNRDVDTIEQWLAEINADVDRQGEHDQEDIAYIAWDDMKDLIQFARFLWSVHGNFTERIIEADEFFQKRGIDPQYGR